MAGAVDHYETLGVPPDATADEIRVAYRRLARIHHPDRNRADAGRMAAVNDAYRVLADPARRAVYDASGRRSAASDRPAAPSTPPFGSEAGASRRAVDAGPAKIPWKLMGAMFAVGATVVLIATALYEAPDPRPADGLLEPGSCVVIEPNGDAREVVCGAQPDERSVAALVVTGDPCPVGTEAHRDGQGRGTACLVPATTPGS